MNNLSLASTCLLVVFLFSFDKDILAQELNYQAKNDAILKNYKKSPYGKGANSWLNKKGFYVYDYNWNDNEINLHLEKAVGSHRVAPVLMVVGIASSVLSGLIYSTQAIADTQEQEDWAKRNGYIFLGIGSGLIVLSIHTFSRANKQVDIAKKIRY